MDLWGRKEKVNLGETKEGVVGEYNQNTLYEILKTTNKNSLLGITSLQEHVYHNGEARPLQSPPSSLS